MAASYVYVMRYIDSQKKTIYQVSIFRTELENTFRMSLVVFEISHVTFSKQEMRLTVGISSG